MWGSKSDMIKGFSRQEYCSGLPCPPPGDVPHPGIEPGSLALQADSWPSEPPGKPLWSRELWSSQALYKTNTINIWSCVELKHTKTSKKTHNPAVLLNLLISSTSLCVCVCVCVCLCVRAHACGLRWKTRIQLSHCSCSIHVVQSPQDPVGPYYNLFRVNVDSRSVMSDSLQPHGL